VSERAVDKFGNIDGQVSAVKKPDERSASPYHPSMAVERARVLISVKASPEIGRNHGETVCVAGVRLDTDKPRWIRLFPVPWQWFWRNEHPKYQVIDIEIEKHNKDQRPESYRPRLDTARIVEQLPPGKRRAEILGALPQHTACELVAAKGWARPSLGVVVLRQVTDIDYEDHSSEANHAVKMNRAAQGSLLAQGAPKLEFSPFAFKLSYRCQSPSCAGHRQTIVDWEISEAWRNWRHEYPDDYLKRIEDKWRTLVAPDRQPALFLGNQQQAPQGFLVLGIARDITQHELAPTDRDLTDASLRPTGDTRKGPPQSTEARLFDP